MTEVLVVTAQAASVHGHHFTILQPISCSCIIFSALEVMVVERVVQSKLTAPVVELCEYRLASIHCGQGVGKLRTNHIAAHRFLHLDIDDVRHIIPISYSGFVDEFYMIDTLHIERKQIVTGSNDVVDAHLNVSKVRQCGNATHGFVNTDVGQCELRQQGIAVRR